MHEDQRIILAIASRLLTYPGEAEGAEREEIRQGVEEDVQYDALKERLRELLDGLWQHPQHELQQIYVDAFDWKEATGLYLTAHEYGDDRKRGGGLIQLQLIISEAGFERNEGELADYMPMLYELLAASNDAKVERKLIYRMGKATWRIYDAFDDGHPYKPVFKLLTDFVFKAPTKEEMQNMGEEKPDLAPMPFPLLYE